MQKYKKKLNWQYFVDLLYGKWSLYGAVLMPILGFVPICVGFKHTLLPDCWWGGGGWANKCGLQVEVGLIAAGTDGEIVLSALW